MKIHVSVLKAILPTRDSTMAKLHVLNVETQADQ